MSARRFALMAAAMLSAVFLAGCVEERYDRGWEDSRSWDEPRGWDGPRYRQDDWRYDRRYRDDWRYREYRRDRDRYRPDRPRPDRPNRPDPIYRPEPQPEPLRPRPPRQSINCASPNAQMHPDCLRDNPWPRRPGGSSSN